MKLNYWYHFVARTHPGYSPFQDDPLAHSLWAEMRATFPTAAAAVIMPNHIHVLAQTEDVESAIWSLGRKLRLGLKKFNHSPLMLQPVPLPHAIPDSHHLLRQIRYVHLNPCRAKLTGHPFYWKWSTHHDYLGLTLNPWTKFEHLRTLGIPFRTKEAFDQYIYSDPSVTQQVGRAEFKSIPIHLAIHSPLVQIQRSVGTVLKNQKPCLATAQQQNKTLCRILNEELGMNTFLISRLFHIPLRSVQRYVKTQVSHELRQRVWELVHRSNP